MANSAASMTWPRRILIIALLTIVLAAVAGVVAGLSFRTALGPATEIYPARAVHAPNGVIATSQPLASQAGLAVLSRGGNAVDAAVTAAAVLGVLEPHMSGLGGDLFAIVWSEQTQRLHGLNASGRSGSLMTPDRLAVMGRISSEGATSVTIPGALSGWAALLEAHGTIDLADALAPAIALADAGFPVSDVTASEWASHAWKLREYPGARDTFLMGETRAPRTGEWFANPDLAASMRAIADEGIGVLYGGALGQRLVDRLSESGGYLTLDDFVAHTAEWVDPISVPFGQFRLWELPPNGQGIAALEMLRILEGFDLSSMAHNSPAYLHHLIEAKKLAYADLEHAVGDPDFMTTQPAQLLSDSLIERRRALIDPHRAIRRTNADPSLGQSDTTYIAVADAQGNMVSLIASVAGMFGSNIVVPGTGFPLQNRGVGFRYAPGYANSAAPNRRPFHTIIPGFVTRTSDDGKDVPWLSFGVVGGPQQPQAHVQVLLNMLLFGMDIQQAIDAPRFRHWSDNQVSFESAIPDATIDTLRDMGHAPQNPVMETAHAVMLGPNRGLIFGGAQGIARADRGYVAGTDSRRDGLAAAH